MVRKTYSVCQTLISTPKPVLLSCKRGCECARVCQWVCGCVIYNKNSAFPARKSRLPAAIMNMIYTRSFYQAGGEMESLPVAPDILLKTRWLAGVMVSTLAARREL